MMGNDNINFFISCCYREYMKIINRDALMLIASTVALSVVMINWIDLFIFSKSVHLPSWMKIFPWPIYMPSFLGSLCFFPAAFGTTSMTAAAKAILISCFFSTFFALTIHTLRFFDDSNNWIENFIFNYFWIIFFHFATGAVVLFLIRLLIVFFISKIKNKF